MAMDPYQTLGVDQSASDQQIKAAFRKLAVQYHPDRGGDEEVQFRQWRGPAARGSLPGDVAGGL